MSRSARSLFLTAVAIVMATTHATAGTLDSVKERGKLNCGVNPGLAGFSTASDADEWSGFDVDYCRAIAAAVLGDPEAVSFVPLTARERFRELQSGKVDVLIRDTAWTMARDTTFGLTFAGVNYYSGVGFMVPRALGVDSALQLTGAQVCLESGSAVEAAVVAYFAAHEMGYTRVMVENDEAQKEAYESGGCNVLTGDQVSLHGLRLRLDKPDDSIVLPDYLSKEPYGPVVLQGDDRWFAVVKWVHFALLNAEELGVTSDNVEGMRTGTGEDVRNLLGTQGAFGEGIGLTNDWAANAIKAVGNYGEIFERNLGSGSALRIDRGLNALWTNGGIQFAPPVR
jgi:general L-amino acid transport system substrate-binding protein